MAATLGTSAEARAEFEDMLAMEEVEELFVYDAEEQDRLESEKAWRSDPRYFKRARVSAVALLKLLMHAHSSCKGERKTEVMGILLGQHKPHELVIMDYFALPIQGEEAFVTASDEANVYMAEYIALLREGENGRKIRPIGWGHSHPSYRAFLSATDVGTQRNFQNHWDPWGALVVDPVTSVTSSQLELGVFRTLPVVPGRGADGWQDVPPELIEQFGVHAHEYYPLEVSYYKSKADAALLDILWNKYWVSTLSSNVVLSNREYFASAINDVAKKMEDADEEIAHSGRMASSFRTVDSKPKTEPTKLSQVSKTSSKLSVEQVEGLMGQVVKDMLFNF